MTDNRRSSFACALKVLMLCVPKTKQTIRVISGFPFGLHLYKRVNSVKRYRFLQIFFIGLKNAEGCDTILATNL